MLLPRKYWMLFVGPSVCLSVCLPACLSVCLPAQPGPALLPPRMAWPDLPAAAADEALGQTQSKQQCSLDFNVLLVVQTDALFFAHFLLARFNSQFALTLAEFGVRSLKFCARGCAYQTCPACV